MFRDGSKEPKHVAEFLLLITNIYIIVLLTEYITIL